jgi:hypothetical protein
MTINEINRYRDKMHHRAVFHMKDGSKVEGYMQPWDEESGYVYLTKEDSTSGGKLLIADVQNITFPDDGG